MTYSPFGNVGLGGSPFGTANDGLGGAPFGGSSAQPIAPLSFTDPLLQTSFRSPADYSKFSQRTGPQMSDVWGVMQPGENYWAYDGNAINKDEKGAYFMDPSTRKRRDLNDAENRAYATLQDPSTANYFDLRNAPKSTYDAERQWWYSGGPRVYGQPISPSENFYKYFPREDAKLSELDKKYGVTSSNYIPIDYFMWQLHKDRPQSPSLPTNTVARARVAGQAWLNQPMMQGRNLVWDTIAPWATEQRAKMAGSYIQEEEEEIAKKDAAFDKMMGLLAGGFMMGMGAPWQVSTLWNAGRGIAGGNMSGALMSLASPLVNNIIGGVGEGVSSALGADTNLFFDDWASPAGVPGWHGDAPSAVVPNKFVEQGVQQLGKLGLRGALGQLNPQQQQQQANTQQGRQREEQRRRRRLPPGMMGQI